MFDIAKKLLMARELKMDEGSIELLGERVQFIPTQMLVEFLHNADDYWGESYLQYEGTKKAVQRWFKTVSEKKGLAQDKLVEWEVNIFNLSGWGRFTFDTTKLLEGKAVITIKNSAIAQTYLNIYQKSKFPVCHTIRGGIAGGANYLNNRTDLEIIEKKCIAQGNPICELVLNSRKDFLNLPIKYHKQINLNPEASP